MVFPSRLLLQVAALPHPAALLIGLSDTLGRAYLPTLLRSASHAMDGSVSNGLRKMSSESVPTHSARSRRLISSGRRWAYEAHSDALIAPALVPIATVGRSPCWARAGSSRDSTPAW